LDTVLGLSMTRARVGWVLVEGQDADGATLDHDEFAVRNACGVDAVDNAEQVTAAVLQTRAMVDARAQRLHAVGVTWSEDAAADAALLLESLTDAGLDNVVPIRFLRAAESLTRGIGPVIGSEKAAVCFIEDCSATLVMVGNAGGRAQTAITQAIDDDGLIGWLTTMCREPDWRPDGLVVAGSGSTANLDVVARRLETTLVIPVFTQTGGQLALARGAASAATPSAEFSDAPPTEAPGARGGAHRRSRPLAYAGGVAMLAAGAVTFVVSLSLAVGLQLAPGHGPGPVEQAAGTAATPPIEESAVPPRSSRATAVRSPVVNHPPQLPPPEEPGSAAPGAELAEETAPDQAEPDEVEPDEVEPDEAAPDEAAPDEAEPDELQPDEVEPDEAEPTPAP
jgi:hypothetical protein